MIRWNHGARPVSGGVQPAAAASVAFGCVRGASLWVVPVGVSPERETLARGWKDKTPDVALLPNIEVRVAMSTLYIHVRPLAQARPQICASIEPALSTDEQ